MKIKKIIISSIILSSFSTFADFVNPSLKTDFINLYNNPKSTDDQIDQAILFFEKYSYDDPHMMFYLGKANYENNRGNLKMDKKRGMSLIEKAAIKNDPEANYYYAELLFKDKPKKAIELLKKAAQLKQKDAQYKLGKMYYLGHLLPLNKDIGFKFMLSSANEGQKNAQYDIAKIYFAQQNENIQREGVYWLEKSVRNGNYAACDDLYKIYYAGMLVPKNIEKHVNYLSCSAMINHNNDAKSILASYYENGTFVNSSIDTAMGLYKGLAKDKHPKAAIKYASYIFNTSPRNKTELDNAINYLKDVSEKDVDSSLMLGDLYNRGFYSIQKDRTKAIKYYQQAKDLGSQIAENKLFNMFKK